MKELNRIRMAAGLNIDPTLECNDRAITSINTVQESTDDKNLIADKKALKAQKRCIERAIKYLKSTIDVLEAAPVIELDKTTVNLVRKLEDILGSDNDNGIESHYEKICSKLRKLEASDSISKRREEEEETFSNLRNELDDAKVNDYVDTEEDDADDVDVDGADVVNTGEDDSFGSDISDSDESYSDEETELEQYIETLTDDQREALRNVISILSDTSSDNYSKKDAFESFVNIVGDVNLKEAMHFYSINYDGYEEVGNPINVTNSKDNVWKQIPAQSESPSQLNTLSDRDNSKQDKSGNDQNNKIKVPAKIKKSLKTEITKALDDADRLSVKDKDSSAFYHRLANAFNDILTYLDNGTVYDIKQAQTYAQGLMGPMLHKLPKDVWSFLANGGEVRSLKSYMREIK